MSFVLTMFLLSGHSTISKVPSRSSWAYLAAMPSSHFSPSLSGQASASSIVVGSAYDPAFSAASGIQYSMGVYAMAPTCACRFPRPRFG
jgi:hypothetical protein